jgi:hypothetical protein
MVIFTKKRSYAKAESLTVKILQEFFNVVDFMEEFGGKLHEISLKKQ